MKLGQRYFRADGTLAGHLTLTQFEVCRGGKYVWANCLALLNGSSWSYSGHWSPRAFKQAHKALLAEGYSTTLEYLVFFQGRFVGSVFMPDISSKAKVLRAYNDGVKLNAEDYSVVLNLG